MSEKSKKRIYLASNLGFSKSQRELILPKISAVLSGLGYEVKEPFAANNQEVKETPMPLKTAHRIALKDLSDVIQSDAVLLVLNGEPPDTGVYFEAGAAAAMLKKTFILRDDFRLCTDCLDFPVNLMALAGLPPGDKESHVYQSIEELSRPEKALARFSRGEDVYPFKPLDEPAKACQKQLIRHLQTALQTL